MTETLFDDYQPERIVKASDEQYTPKWIFDALGCVFHMDVCAPTEGPRHTPCIRWIDAQQDGLTTRWRGMVWMNPPYSNATPWIDKWIEHGNGICLVPFAKSLWLNRLWQSRAVCVPMQPSLKFEQTDYTMSSIMLPVALWAIGNGAIDTLRHANLGKVR